MAIAKPSTRAQKKQATRTRILKAASRALEQQGFEETNIRDLAKQCGVAAGTVLLHFHDKQDLMFCCFFDDLERRSRDAVETASHASLEEDLVALFQALFDFHAARPKLAPALLREAWFAEPPWADRLRTQEALLAGHILELARQAQERGDLPARANADLVPPAFFSFHRQAMLGWLEDPDAEPCRRFRQMLREYLCGDEKKKAKGGKSKKRKNKKSKKHPEDA